MTKSSDIQVFKIDKAKAFSYIIKDLKKRELSYNFCIIDRKGTDDEIRAMIVALYCFEAQRQASRFSQEKKISTINAQDSLDYFLSKQEIDTLLEYTKSACSISRNEEDNKDIRVYVCKDMENKD